jgi:hypothetical protein
MPRSVQCIAVAIFMAATVIVSSACKNLAPTSSPLQELVDY